MSRPPLPGVRAAGQGGPLEMLRRAVMAYQADDLSQAASCCRLVLAAQRKQFDALHLMGLIEFRRGKRAEALESLRQAIKVNPRSADAHTNQAMVINDVKGPAEALASLDRALAIDPNHVLALNNRGNFLWRLKRPQEALATLERAVAIAPTYADAQCNLGNVLFELERYEEAVSRFERAVAINPRDHLAWHNRGNALYRMQRLEAALDSYEKSLAIRPDDVLVLIDYGTVLSHLRRWEKALAAFDRVLATKPDHIVALRSRGRCLWLLKRSTEALDTYERVLSLSPDVSDHIGDRANVLSDLGRLDEALASYDQALLLKADNAEHRFNRSLLKLRTGDFDGGWQDYEWRFKKADTEPRLRSHLQPQWDGVQSLQGKTVLLWAEQGLGDTIQFARYAPMVAARADRVILEVQPALKNLLAPLDGVSQVVGVGDDLPPFDCHYPLLSLPLAFKTTLETIPASTPGLLAPPDRVTKWRERLAALAKPRVAIAWAGNANFLDDGYRSIGLARLAPLIALPGFQFVSIQKSLRTGDAEVLLRSPHVMHLGDEIEDFGDTAAIMSLVDIVISSDTSVVHLAGALERPVWILLHHTADWRWLLDRDDSPWYPSARLFRQRDAGAWDQVVQSVGAELAGWKNG